MMENKMFCYQCQETVGNQGCSQVGVCGKTPETAGLQDLLIDVTKGLAEVINEVRCKGKEINNVYIGKDDYLIEKYSERDFDDELQKMNVTFLVLSFAAVVQQWVTS